MTQKIDIMERNASDLEESKRKDKKESRNDRLEGERNSIYRVNRYIYIYTCQSETRASSYGRKL